MTLPGLSNRVGAVAELPALGLLTLAGLVPSEWRCSYHDVDKWDEALVRKVVDEDPAVVAVSALTASIGEAYAFCGALKRQGIPTIIGGLHVTACPQEAARHCDAVVAGEGEPVWLDLIKDLQQGALRKLYGTRQAFDLRNSKPPRFDLAAKSLRSRFTIQTQRGCPLACEFCAASRLLGTFREKPADVLAEEIRALLAVAPAPVLELADDNTFAGHRNCDELFEVLKSAHCRYFTESDWRIGERPDLLRGLAASGCVQVLVGIESLVHAYRGMGQKKADRHRVLAALDTIQDHGVAVIGCFVLGAEGETSRSIEGLTRFILDCQLSDVQVTLQTPFPGTAVRKRLEYQGRLLADRGWEYYTLFDLTFVPDQMSVAELERGYRELAYNVFSVSENARRLGIRRKTWAKSPLARNEKDSITPTGEVA
jgi:radical SAM superfamily enzyme YgiQ (UPF0313 family)